MYLQIFTILVSFGLCFASYLEETHFQTNHKLYNGRFMNPKYEQFGVMARTHRPPIAPYRSQKIVNVNDYGAKANDGQIDNEVTLATKKKSKIYLYIFDQILVITVMSALRS